MAPARHTGRQVARLRASAGARRCCAQPPKGTIQTTSESHWSPPMASIPLHGNGVVPGAQSSHATEQGAFTEHFPGSSKKQALPATLGVTCGFSADTSSNPACSWPSGPSTQPRKAPTGHGPPFSPTEAWRATSCSAFQEHNCGLELT